MHSGLSAAQGFLAETSERSGIDDGWELRSSELLWTCLDTACYLLAKRKPCCGGSGIAATVLQHAPKPLLLEPLVLPLPAMEMPAETQAVTSLQSGLLGAAVVATSLLSMMTAFALVSTAGGLRQSWRCCVLALQAVCRWLHSQLGWWNSRSSCERILEERLKEEHLVNMRAGTLAASVVVGLIAVAVLMEVCVAGNRRYSTEGFLVVCAVWLLLLASNAIVCKAPGRLTLLSVSYHACMLLWCLYVTSWISPVLAWALPVSLTFRTLSLCLTRHLAPVLFWNICHAMVVMHQNACAGVIDVICVAVPFEANGRTLSFLGLLTWPLCKKLNFVSLLFGERRSLWSGSTCFRRHFFATRPLHFRQPASRHSTKPAAQSLPPCVMLWWNWTARFVSRKTVPSWDTGFYMERAPCEASPLPTFWPARPSRRAFS